MRVRKIAIADATFEPPVEEADVYTANIVDQRHGGPVTIGYRRYSPNQRIDVALQVDDNMIVLEGRLTVTSDGREMVAGPGEIVYMPKGEVVTIRSHAQGATTAYVTYPHWQEAED